MNRLIFVIGASGSGKTTVIKQLEKQATNQLRIFYFDSIGVPPETEMIEKYHSPEEWQRMMTDQWVKKIKEEVKTNQQVVLDGQTRLEFIKEACLKNGIDHYEIILFDCTDEERAKRLKNRGHPELANPQMMDWANYLRKNCQGFTIIDNTYLSEKETVLVFVDFLKMT